MPEDLGERFYIHAALNCTSGKGMPEGMKTFMRDIRLFQKQLEAALIGADGNGLPVCGHHEGRIAPFFNALRMGSNCLGSGITRREAAVFGSSMTSPPLPSKRETLPSSSPQATTSSAKTTTSSSPAPSKTSTASNTELSSQKTFRNHRSTRWFRFFYARYHALRLPLHNIPRRPSRNGHLYTASSRSRRISAQNSIW